MTDETKGDHDGFWEEQVEIHSYDVDSARKLTLESLLKYFQEAAWNHAEHLGRGYAHLRSQNQVWVLSRMMVVVDSFPEWGQSVVVRTWPCGSMSLLALRDFELLNREGRRLLGATSGWLVLDLQSRRPQRIEPILGSMRAFPEYRAVGMEAARLAPVAESSTPTFLDVRYSDLDLNDHVNNTIYARWILDSYPVEFHRAHRLRSLTLNFLAEVGGDDTVVLSSQELGELRMAHAVRRQIDGAEACRAELVWDNC
jgi:medium-chain acyl-[acyl-carrier-protein] hydrolase